ncbi:MAG: diguanylate cyclase [Rhodoferax sp.]|uniref:sensor domain-containing diguanylate cyclase n=1 Tax=Rhodoferax sp. TaxID=50421 RepID=UPI0014013A5B|nr:sensor domain-containing diguanylate cyclase [Rhodoferax sp.]NDP40942.1 diguanylate cyclase [Rhodoferax sp.]
MKPKRIPTIRSRLILLVMACILPAALLVAALISYGYDQGRAQLVRESMSTARAMMSAVDMELASTQSALLALATSPYLASNDLPAFYAQATDALKNLDVDNVVLFDQNGQQVLNTLLPLGSKLPTDSNTALLQVFKTGRPVTQDIFSGAVRKNFVLVVSVPVRRGDNVIYALAAGRWPERLSALLTQQRLAAGRIAVVYDSSGTIAARTHQMQRFVGTKGPPDVIRRVTQVREDAMDIVTLEGIPVLAVFSRSAISNWTVAIGIPAADLTAQLVQRLWWLVAATVVLLLASLTLAWVIGGQIATSIHQLAAPALALGSGAAVRVPSLRLKEADEVGRALTKASELLVAAQHRGNHDVLTGLANRALFHEFLDHQLAICERTNARLALFYIDLDEFKAVNDLHGHAIGDEVLRTVAARIVASIRKSDLAARLGGDEFALIVNPAELDTTQVLAAKLLDILSAPYSIGALTLELSASIGIANYPELGTTSEALAHHADRAMYQAKAAGKRRYAVAA